MLKSNLPSKIPTPWGSSAGVGFINVIPNISQIGIKDGRASFPDGFPPLCFVPVDSGGVPPFGADFNGIFNQISAGLQWLQAGGIPVWDSTFSTTIGGYPQDAVVASPNYPGLLWISQIDNNTANPDTSTGTYWTPFNRWRLSSQLNLYVNASSGDDSNNGLTSGTPWLTLQHAIDWVAANVDIGLYQVMINASGAFTEGITNFTNILGNGVSKVIFNFTSGSTIQVLSASAFIASGSSTGFQVQTASGTPLLISATGTGNNEGYGLLATDEALITFNNVNFGTCQSGHAVALYNGQIKPNGSYSISGNAPSHWLCQTGFFQSLTPNNPNVVTLIGTPSFTSSFVNCSGAGKVMVSNLTIVFSGAASGQRYFVGDVSLIDTFGSGASFFPGTIAGVATNTWNYN